MSAAELLAWLALAAWAYLMLLHGRFWLAGEREELDLPPVRETRDWPRVAAVIPARNEADMIPKVACLAHGAGLPGGIFDCARR